MAPGPAQPRCGLGKQRPPPWEPGKTHSPGRELPRTASQPRSGGACRLGQLLRLFYVPKRLPHSTPFSAPIKSHLGGNLLSPS